MDIRREMPQVSSTLIKRKPTARSRVSNHPRIFPGAGDQRTRDARRFRDIVDQLLGEFGDFDLERIRELALLKFRLERQTDASLEDVVRLGNLIARRERELRDAKRAKPNPTPSIADIAARHQRGAV